MTTFKNFALRIGALAAIAIPAFAHAQTDAIDLTTLGSVYQDGDGWSLGYQFTTGASPINVTALGYFDNGAAFNLTENHVVGIFNSSGVLLMSANVNYDEGLFQSNYFGYTNGIAGPTQLAANSTYYVAGSSGFVDPYQYDGTFVTGSDITFVQNQYVGGNSLNFPIYTEGGIGDGFLGGTFQYQAVPEPAPFAVCGLGLIGLIARRKRAARG